MVIRTDIARLQALSLRLRRLEDDLSQISSQVARASKMTAQSVKYRSSDYQIRRASDKVLASVDSVNRSARAVCDRVYRQSVLLGNAVSSYRENDKVSIVNRGALYNAGASLRGFFGNATINSYSSRIPNWFVRILANTK